MDWIENNVAQELPGDLIEMDEEVATKSLPSSIDMGPCETQTLSGLQEDLHNGCEIDSVLGLLPSMAPHLPKEKDKEVLNSLNTELDHHNKKIIPLSSSPMLPPHL